MIRWPDGPNELRRRFNGCVRKPSSTVTEWKAQDCGISKAAKDTSMLPSKIDQMKVSHETGSEANIGFGCALMPSYLEMCPQKAAFSSFQTQPKGRISRKKADEDQLQPTMRNTLRKLSRLTNKNCLTVDRRLGLNERTRVCLLGEGPRGNFKEYVDPATATPEPTADIEPEPAEIKEPEPKPEITLELEPIMSDQGFLVPPTPPLSVIALPTSWTSGPSASLFPSTTLAQSASSFPSAPPWSSVAPPSPQSSGTPLHLSSFTLFIAAAPPCTPEPASLPSPCNPMVPPGSPKPASQSLVALVPAGSNMAPPSLNSAMGLHHEHSAGGATLASPACISILALPVLCHGSTPHT
ncbi:hypothetical protein DPX16_20695 [Anabarilius grahami]|uniref:Uncharacterized protein n=1 Tax=Anabarilius grahami TaxID=495550 RepID=A0A3N0YLH1_ANAGA|nr:hypothetical protein DPX16_20695 [Anabarilius grahami]